MTIVVVNMPGGDVEHIDADQLLWMREAFDHEFKGAVMLKLGGDTRLYSIESLAALETKFQEAGGSLVRLTPPEGNLSMVVNASKVREVEPPNSAIYDANAKAVLVFGSRLRLAVRETQQQAQAILDAAAKPTGANVGAIAGAVIGAAAGAVAGAAVQASADSKPKR